MRPRLPPCTPATARTFFANNGRQRENTEGLLQSSLRNPYGIERTILNTTALGTSRRSKLMNDRRESMEWLVKNRIAIQETALKLYDLLPEDGEPLSTIQISLIRQDLVGAFFCLWRGVFLAHDKKNVPGKPIEHAKEFLKKVIETNTIAFNDDKNASQWTANFYVDGAGRILAGFPTSKRSNATPRCEKIWPPWKIEDYPSQIKDRWKYNHKILKGKIRSFGDELKRTKDRKTK